MSAARYAEFVTSIAVPYDRLSNVQKRWRVFAECRRMKQQLGYVNYAKVGESLGISRQSVFKKLRQMLRDNQITQAEYDSASGEKVASTPHSGEKIRREVSLTPENSRFVDAMADALNAYPEVVVNNALNAYRQSKLGDALRAPSD